MGSLAECIFKKKTSQHRVSLKSVKKQKLSQELSHSKKPDHPEISQKPPAIFKVSSGRRLIKDKERDRATLRKGRKENTFRWSMRQK
jgi:hypothetical protein